jgi:cytochrome c oxidase accessory protein FixG
MSNDHKSNKIEITDVTDPNNPQSGELYASRVHIYVRLIKGYFTNIRVMANAGLFLVFFGTVWLNWGGKQAVLFDLTKQQFSVFSLTFFPQDFALLTWILIIAAFALFLITVFAGRIWCGYTCPQSVWTWVFMWIETKTEGKRNARIKLDKSNYSHKKLLRKTAKHTLWLIMAFITGLTFVGYFLPVRELMVEFFTFQSSGWAYFWVSFFTLATYGNAGWLREQVCFYMCPYARFQSVMFDKDTLIVSYDEARGEGRGSRKKGKEAQAQAKEEGLGDCIDCDLCVHVCPVGIDIRDGLQYECISCAACIDACDSVMDQMGYERGLVSYTTEHGLKGEKTKVLRPRIIGYAAALLIMIVALIWTLSTRVPLELDLIRDRDELFHKVKNTDLIENRYRIQLTNMDVKAHQYKVSVAGIEGIEIMDNKIIEMTPTGNYYHAFKLRAPKGNVGSLENAIEVTVQSIDDDSILVTEKSTFFGPLKF